MSGEPILSDKVGIREITTRGFWIDLGREELYVAYADFPWFADATEAQIEDVQRPSAEHLYWPALDVDLSVASLRHPSVFPLIAAQLAPR